MKLYASSYRIGSDRDQLRELLPIGCRIAVVTNALDFSDDVGRRVAGLKRECADLSEFGAAPEEMDLRQYFGDPASLKECLDGFHAVWVTGGNVFVLRRAMRQSGMDEILRAMSRGVGDFVYAGYSAGACVLAPTLRGIDLVDSPSVIPQGYSQEIVWDGLGLLDVSIAPHYRSDHPESNRIEAVVEYFAANNLPFVSLRDGEATVFDASRSRWES